MPAGNATILYHVLTKDPHPRLPETNDAANSSENDSSLTPSSMVSVGATGTVSANYVHSSFRRIIISNKCCCRAKLLVVGRTLRAKRPCGQITQHEGDCRAWTGQAYPNIQSNTPGPCRARKYVANTSIYAVLSQPPTPSPLMQMPTYLSMSHYPHPTAVCPTRFHATPSHPSSLLPVPSHPV